MLSPPSKRCMIICAPVSLVFSTVLAFLRLLRAAYPPLHLLVLSHLQRVALSNLRRPLTTLARLAGGAFGSARRKMPKTTRRLVKPLTTPLPVRTPRHPRLTRFQRQARVTILTLRQISPTMRSMLMYAASLRSAVSSRFTLFRQVFDEELDGDRSMVEKTVNLSVADGEKYCSVNDPIDNRS